VIDCGLSTSGSGNAGSTPSTPNLTTLVPTSTRYGAPTATILPSTPNTDGTVIHVVAKGDTLYGIAFAYGVTLKDLLALNNLTATSTIYIGQKIIVRAAFTPTATLPTSTPTHFPTATPWPTSTATFTASPPPPPSATATKSTGLPSSAAGVAVILIIIAAAIVAGAISVIGRRKTE
jgi:LysM repeat protein